MLIFEKAQRSRVLGNSEGFAAVCECRCRDCGSLVSRAGSSDRILAMALAVAQAYRAYANDSRDRTVTISVEYMEERDVS